jgi:hypothetical protein
LGDVDKRNVELIAQPLECFEVVFPGRGCESLPFRIALGIAKAVFDFPLLCRAINVANGKPTDETAESINGERVRGARAGARSVIAGDGGA